MIVSINSNLYYCCSVWICLFAIILDLINQPFSLDLSSCCAKSANFLIFLKVKVLFSLCLVKIIVSCYVKDIVNLFGFSSK
jgi:hypothetical protein